MSDLAKSVGTYDDKLEGEKTCQPHLKSQKMNAWQLSPAENIQRPPEGSQGSSQRQRGFSLSVENYTINQI